MNQKQALPPTKEDPKKPSLYEAQRLRTLAMAEREQIRNRVISGELVKRSEVDKEFFKIARTVRDGCENLPARLAPLTAAESDQHKCFELIRKEVNQVLEALSR